jgi:hypothetical protein
MTERYHCDQWQWDGDTPALREEDDSLGTWTLRVCPRTVARRSTPRSCHPLGHRTLLTQGWEASPVKILTSDQH